MAPRFDWFVRPGVGIGPIELGMSAAAVEQLVSLPRRESERGGIRFLYFEGLTVVLQGGCVSMVVAEPSSMAQLEGSTDIRVGMSYKALADSLPAALSYDDEEGLWRSEVYEGVLFEIARPAEPGEEPIDPPFVPELHDVTRPETAVVRRMFVQ